jgi:hypothetical protein
MSTLSGALQLDPGRRWRRLRVRVVDRWLTGWFIAWFLVYAWGGGMAWHFFVQGQQVLLDPDNLGHGGLHLYAGLPQLQIGPLALLAAGLFSGLGPQVSLVLAQCFGAAAGVAVLVLAGAIARAMRPDLTGAEIGRRIRWAAVFFIPVWLYLAVASVHLDDVLALLFGVLATHAAVHQRAVTAGLCAGLAADAKPWALPFVAVLLVLAGRRARLAGLGAAAAAVVFCWLPFLLSDPHTLNAMRYTIPNTPRTALRVLGIDVPRTPPWDRPAQALLGLLLAGIAVRRGRWAAVILVATAARIVLDPGTNLYYSAGAVAGAALWDIAGSARRLPYWTALAAGTLFLARYVPLPQSAYGWLTLCFFVACAVSIVAFRARPGVLRLSRSVCAPAAGAAATEVPESRGAGSEPG